MSTIQLTCFMMYVSSSISTALSSNRDFLFATTTTACRISTLVNITKDFYKNLNNAKVVLKEHLQIVSFSSLANVLLKSFPILLEGK